MCTHSRKRKTWMVIYSDITSALLVQGSTSQLHSVIVISLNFEKALQTYSGNYTNKKCIVLIWACIHCFGFPHISVYKCWCVCLCVSTVFRVDLFCSGKVDGEAVLTIQLNVTIQTNNYTVLNFKRRKMCYKSESSRTSPLPSVYVCRVCLSFQTVSTSLGGDPDAEIPQLPLNFNNSLQRPDRKHHQHHVNLLQQVVLAITTNEAAASLHRPSARSVKTFHRRCGWCQRSRRGRCLVSPSVGSPWPGLCGWVH